MGRTARLLRGPANHPTVESLGRYAWRLLDVDRYVRDDPTVAPRTLNYVSSQGCAYTCRFCYKLTCQHRYGTIGAADFSQNPTTRDAVRAMLATPAFISRSPTPASSI